MTDESMARAKRLMAKLKLGRLNKAIGAWRELYELEQSIQQVEAVAHPVAECLDKKPSDRTPKDIARLVPLVAQMRAYQGLAPPVHEFLATYVSLDVVWDNVEMPRSTADCNSLFSVLSGGMKGVAAEVGDPQLMVMAKMAAQQLMRTSQEDKQLDSEESKAEASDTITELAPAVGSKKDIDTLSRFGLGAQYNTKEVTSQLWRTIMEMMHQGLMPSRTHAMEMLSGIVHNKKAAPPPPPGRMSLAGAPAVGSSSLRMSSSGASSIMAARMSTSGAGPASSMSGALPQPRASQGGAPPGRQSMPGIASRGPSVYSGVGPALVELHVGDSFSGRDMDCRSDVGHVELQVAEVPPRVQGAVCMRNTVTALLVVSRGAYRRAMQMQQEISIRNAVDSCCRLPFLRHTPLKELYKLSKHLTASRFNRGDVLISQGKEHPSVFFLLEGEVELVVDVPLTQDKDTLLANLLQMVGRDPSVGLGPRARSVAGVEGALDGSGGDLSPPVMAGKRPGDAVAGPMQRVVLGRRGPGVILGDDSIREKHMVVTVVAVTPVMALSTSAQRFTASLDGLTQRLFSKLRAQNSATSELGRAITDVSLRQALLERLRSEIMTQTFAGLAGVPTTLKRERDVEKPKQPWVRIPPEGLFSKTVGLAAGEHYAALEAAGSDERRKSGRSSSGGGAKVDPNLPSSTGLRVDMFKDSVASDSLSTFLQVVKGVEEQRMAESSARLKRAGQEMLDVTVGVNKGVVNKLDLSDVLVGTASVHQKYTDMLEAACLAIIKIGALPGQSPVASEILSPVLDDAIVAWSQLTHSCGLQLVRWTSHEYYLIGGLNPGGQRRPLVRIMADALLEMKGVFYRNMGQSDVPYFYFAASMVIGTVFSSYDCGRFLSGVTGHAFDAASKLCDQVLQKFPCGAILVSDAVMQAIGRTHHLEVTGAGYQLLGRVYLPFGATLESMLGKGTLDKEPVSAGNPKAGLFRIQSERNTTSHFGDTNGFSLDDGFASVQAPNTHRMSNLVVKLPAFQDDGLRQTASPIGSGAPSPIGGGSKRDHSNSLGPVKSRAASFSSLHDAASSTTVGAPSTHARVAPNTTLEPQLHLTRTGRQRDQLLHRSNMDFRKQLRQELGNIRASMPVMPTFVNLTAKHAPAGGSEASSPEHRGGASARAAGASGPQRRSAPPSNLHLPLEEVVGSPAVHGMTPYLPGTSPLASMSARKRVAQMVFSYDEGTADGSAGGAEGVGLLALPVAGRPASPGRLGSPLPPGLASLQGRPHAGERAASPQGEGFFLTAGGSVRNGSPVSGTRSRPLSRQRSRRPSDSRGNDTVATNFGPVALPPLEVTLHTPPGGHLQPRQGGHRNAESDRLRGVHGATLPQDALKTGGVARSGRMQQVDPLSGLTGQEIHKQAITTWKDLGSLRAAEEYVQQLNPALINISFSTGGLTCLPNMSRLPYLESVAASFNNFGSLSGSSQLSSLAPHIKILTLSHSNISELPGNLGEVLPHLLELNVSSNSLSALPHSLFTHATKLTALSFEHNSISIIPSTASQLQNLQQLFASDNDIEELFDNMFDNMPRLQVVDVSFNAIKELPASATKLVSLHTLVASCNLLETLPEGLLAAATALTRLELAENSLYKCGQTTGFSPEELKVYNAKYNALADECEDDLDTMLTGVLSRVALSSYPGDNVQFASGGRSASKSGTLLHPTSSNGLPRTQSMKRAMSLLHANSGSRSLSANAAAAQADDVGEAEEPTEQPRSLSATGDTAAGPAGDIAEPGSMAAAVAVHEGELGTSDDGGGFQPQPPGQAGPSGMLAAKLGPGCRSQTPQRVCIVEGSEAATSAGLGAGSAAAAGSGGSGTHTRPRSALKAADAGRRDQPTSSAITAADRLPQPLFGISPFSNAAASQLDPSALEEAEARTPCEAVAAVAATHPGPMLLPQLQVLDLSSNRLLAIPPWLPPSIRQLHLARNQLASFQDWVAQRLTSLQLLDMHGNKILHVSRDLTRLTTLQMVALQENPCTDVETSDAPKGHATGATGGSVAWLEQHVSKLKYRVKVDNMNGAGGTASSAGMAS